MTCALVEAGCIQHPSDGYASIKQASYAAPCKRVTSSIEQMVDVAVQRVVSAYAEAIEFCAGAWCPGRVACQVSLNLHLGPSIQ